MANPRYNLKASDFLPRGIGRYERRVCPIPATTESDVDQVYRNDFILRAYNAVSLFVIASAVTVIAVDRLVRPALEKILK